MLRISPIIEWNIFFFFFGQKLNRIPWTNPIDERSFQCKLRFKVELNVSSGKKKKLWNQWALTIVLQSKIYSRIFTKKIQSRAWLASMPVTDEYSWSADFCLNVSIFDIFLFYDHIYSHFSVLWSHLFSTDCRSQSLFYDHIFLLSRTSWLGQLWPFYTLWHFLSPFHLQH